MKKIFGEVSSVKFDGGTMSAPAVFYMTFSGPGPEESNSYTAVSKMAKRMHEGVAAGAKIWIGLADSGLVQDWGLDGELPNLD